MVSSPSLFGCKIPIIKEYVIVIEKIDARLLTLSVLHSFFILPPRTKLCIRTRFLSYCVSMSTSAECKTFAVFKTNCVIRKSRKNLQTRRKRGQ